MAITRTGYANFAAFPVTGASNIIYVDLSNGNEYTWNGTTYVAYTGTLAGVRTAYKSAAWFAANPSVLLGSGQKVDLQQTGLYKLGDGVTELSNLEWLSSGGHKDTTWFTANAAVIIDNKRLIFCSDGANQGKYKIGDGVTALSGLTFYGGVSSSYTSSNGITLTGSDFKLGGTLSGATSLNGAVDFKFGNTTPLNNFEVYAGGDGSYFKHNGVLTSIYSSDGFTDNTFSIDPTLTTLGATVYLSQGTASKILATDSNKYVTYLSTTGTGNVVLSTSPTFSTDITTPLIIGGTGITSKVTYTGSSNATPTSTSIAHEFYVGNNGGSEALRILHNGRVGINVNPAYQLHIGGSDTANDGLIVSSATFVNIPNLGTVSNTTLLNPRGFSVATDSTVLTGSYIPTFGVGLASNRSGALLGIKNTSSSGYSILIEDGNMGVFTTNPYTELQVAGNITTTWANSEFGTWYQGGTQYKMGFNTVISNRQLNLHAYTADTGGYITFSTGTVGSPFVNLRINPSQTSGALVNYDFTNPTSTNLTLSTNIPNFKVTGSTKQKATGADPLQYFNWFTSNTQTYVGASTCTLMSNLTVEYAQGGTNSTISTNAAIYVPTLALTNTTTSYGIYANAATGATTNYAAGFSGDVISTGNIISQKSLFAGSTGNAGRLVLSRSVDGITHFTIQSTSSTSASISQTGGSVSTILMSSAGISFQTENSTSPFAQVSRMVISHGDNATITISDNTNFVFSGTTGSKFGTSTTQKLSFWNATPIVQPTTSVAAATLVSNGGTALTDTDTFDGYTLKQIVKALRNTGLLA